MKNGAYKFTSEVTIVATQKEAISPALYCLKNFIIQIFSLISKNEKITVEAILISINICKKFYVFSSTSYVPNYKSLRF